jgi:hypothetical protein
MIPPKLNITPEMIRKAFNGTMKYVIATKAMQIIRVINNVVYALFLFIGKLRFFMKAW